MAEMCQRIPFISTKNRRLPIGVAFVFCINEGIEAAAELGLDKLSNRCRKKTTNFPIK
jgi:hypothetical protein